MGPEKLLEGDEVAREAGIGDRVTLPQRGDNGRPMGGEIVGDRLHHRSPGPTARVKQATRRNGYRGG